MFRKCTAEQTTVLGMSGNNIADIITTEKKNKEIKNIHVPWNLCFSKYKINGLYGFRRLSFTVKSKLKHQSIKARKIRRSAFFSMNKVLKVLSK